MPLIPFGEYLPDLPPRDNPGALEALNVAPKAIGYGPIPTFAAATNALTARCQGAFSVLSLDGLVFNFAGDATKLYLLNSAGTSWTDVSRLAGGAYATDAAGSWSFTQFGNRVIATNGVDVPQSFVCGTSANFIALAGSPPIASKTATVKDFVFLGRVNALQNEVRWSAINDPTDWTVSTTTQSDFQDIPDGGIVMGLVGGESATIFQRYGITRATYIGAEFIFQFDKISRSIGCMAENSIAAWENNSFFLSDNGFYQLVGAEQMIPIGENKVNEFFLSDYDPTNPHRIVGAIDPTEHRYVVIYPSTGASSGLPNKGLIYHWPTARWSRFEVNLEWIYWAQSQSGYTLETLDTPMPSIDGVPQISFDSSQWSGSGRRLLAAFDSTHKQGVFSGDNMAYTVDTGEFELTPGQRTFVRSARTIIDGGTPSLTPITRNIPEESVMVGTAVPIDSLGKHQLRVNARYMRARVTGATGDNWSFLQGIDNIEAVPVGKR